MLRSLPQSQQDLAKEAPLIEGAIRAALQRFTDEHAALRRDYSARSQASIVHDLMIAETRKALDGRPGVRCMITKGTFVVVVRQTYVIKLKKLGDRLRSCNIRTQALLDFIYQRPMQLTLAEVPAETHLIIGYKPTQTELLSATIWVTCPLGSGVRWSWKLETDSVTRVVPIRVPEDGETHSPLFGLRYDDQRDKKRDDDQG